MTQQIPKIQRGAVKEGEGDAGRAPVHADLPVPELGPGQILVKINWTGVCGTDKSFILDEFAGLGIKQAPETRGVAGHEGAGQVVAVHESVKNQWKIGDRAGIKWVATICRECEFCTNGVDEVHCVKQKNSGLTTAGTFQEYVATDAYYATRLPDGVSDEEAGPIMCGGVTAYVACKRSQVKPGQWLVAIGAGGGLGHLGVQYAAKAMGMRVIAIDGGKDKESMCLELGAEHYIDFTQEKDILGKVTGLTGVGAHGVIVFVGNRAGYELAPHLLRPGGTEVAVGMPGDPTILAGAPPAILGMRKLNVVGSVTGTNNEVLEALDFTARGIVKPRLTKGKLEDLDSMIQLMKEGKLAGRAVLQVA